MKTRRGVPASEKASDKRQGNERFDTLIIGFNTTTRGEVQSALDSNPSYNAGPLKMRWAYCESTQAYELPLYLAKR